MTLRRLGVALAAALAIFLALRGGCPRPEPVVKEVRDERRTPQAEPPADPRTDLLPAPPARDIFRYAEAAPTRPAGPRVEAAPPTAAALAEPPPVSAPLLRFVGLVRRPEGLRAAVATASGVLIVGPGDIVLGHAVLAVDEDGGLRVRTPDGTEQTLSAR